MSETLTAEEVAARLKVTEATVYRWVREGTLPARRFGRTLRFSEEDIAAMTDQTVAVPTGDDLAVAAAAFAEALVAEIVRRVQG